MPRAKLPKPSWNALDRHSGRLRCALNGTGFIRNLFRSERCGTLIGQLKLWQWPPQVSRLGKPKGPSDTGEGPDGNEVPPDAFSPVMPPTNGCFTSRARSPGGGRWLPLGARRMFSGRRRSGGTGGFRQVIGVGCTEPGHSIDEFVNGHGQQIPLHFGKDNRPCRYASTSYSPDRAAEAAVIQPQLPDGNVHRLQCRPQLAALLGFSGLEAHRAALVPVGRHSGGEFGADQFSGCCPSRGPAASVVPARTDSRDRGVPSGFRRPG